MLGLRGLPAVSGLDNKILIEQSRNNTKFRLYCPNGGGGDAWVGRCCCGAQLTLFQIQMSVFPTLFN